MSVKYVCPICGRVYETPVRLSSRFGPPVECSGSRSGGKHSRTAMQEVDRQLAD